MRLMPILLGCLLAACAACAPPQDAANQGQGRLAFKAHVIHVPLEGGFYGLEDAAGNHYLPDRIPAALRHDGQPVHVLARPAPPAVGFRMWGRRIIIEEIKAQ